MLQLRGLGLIDSDKIGSSTLRRPRLATGGTVETVPATTGYPVVPTSTGGTPATSFGIMAYQANAVQQPALPIVQPNAPAAQPSLPTPPPLPVPPMATNPSNPTMPAPSGTQVTMPAPQPFYQGSGFKKLGWWLLGLGTLGLGIGFALKRR